MKREAEREGLDEVFRAAGAEWREAGCSMCIAMNGDQLSPGQYAISTSNRNFEGRQGKGGRTFLASPLTAAASAISGVVTDPRTLPGIEALAARRGALTMAAPFADLHAARSSRCPAENVDTDQIVPARYLKVTDKDGLARGALPRLALRRGRRAQGAAVRHGPARDARPADPPRRATTSATGSSREHAPWALTAWGIRAILSTSFADIFRNNALKNGLLPIVVEAERHRQLFELVAADPDVELTVDLEAQVVHLPGDEDLPFEVDPFARPMLLEGTDELGYLLGRSERSTPGRTGTRPGSTRGSAPRPEASAWLAGGPFSHPSAW